jgi:cytochrome c
MRIIGLLPLSMLVACATTPPGASDANLAKAKSQAARGAALFGQHCSGCHGDRGQGGPQAPAVIGGGALRVYPRAASNDNLTTDPNELQLRTDSQVPGAPTRPPFNNAKDLFDYVQKTMPPQAPGSLRAEDTWAILDFMLRAHGVAVPAGGVTAENASSLPTQPE